MKTLELKLEPWGSDKAIRLPAALLVQYKMVDAVEIETLPDALSASRRSLSPRVE